jgi:mRNA-degrading endonuclease toxin of MazEF toxin-antitoxin module
MAIRTGDIYASHDFYGAGKHRVVIVSRTSLNSGNYVVTVMFTSKRLEERKKSPTCVFFPRESQPGLVEDCVAQCETISQVPIEYLNLVGGCLGHVDDEKLAEINQAINYVIDNV